MLHFYHLLERNDHPHLDISYESKKCKMGFGVW